MYFLMLHILTETCVLFFFYFYLLNNNLINQRYEKKNDDFLKNILTCHNFEID